MNDVKPIIAGSVTLANAIPDRAKEFQMELLMEKLRSKTPQHKTLADTSKAVRMTMLDKRWALDSADRQVLQKSLDSLQHCIKVSSLQSLKERLECLTRQLGLKYVVGSSGLELFISSDMFYLEILLDPTGAVKDVKIHHDGKMEQQSDELISCISKGDFADFTEQLEGLTAIYQLNAEKKIKTKAFTALQSLEVDLGTLAQLQSFIKDPWSQVHKSPIGFLQKRRGGHPMKLTYFVSPYELLDKDKGILSLTLDILTLGKLVPTSALSSLSVPKYTPIGQSATVVLEESAAHKLQIAPIITVAPRPMGKSGPIYAPLGIQNSVTLPARFTLRLSQPMVLCSGLARAMRQATEAEWAADWSRARPLLALLVQNAFASQATPNANLNLNLNRGLFVSLPDQSQCYFLTETRGLDGALVSAVPFSHPSHVPALLTCLRQQALFNALITSCVRPDSKQDLKSMLMFELSALSWQHISISLEHPVEESMATVEIDLTDTSAPRAVICTLNTNTRDNMELLNDYISRVLQKSYSIPITLRALVKLWENEALVQQNMNGGYSALDNSNFSLGLGALDPGGPEGNIKQEPPGNAGRPIYPSNVNHPHQGATYLSDMQKSLMLLSNQESTSASTASDSSNQSIPPCASTEDRKSKKRIGLDEQSWQPSKKLKRHSQLSDVLLDSLSDSDSSDDSPNEDDQGVVSNNTSNDEDERAESANSQIMLSDLELSGLDPAELMGSSNDNRMSGSDMENSADGELNDMQYVEELVRNPSFQKPDHKKQKHKSRSSLEKSSKVTTASLLLDLTDNTTYMPSSVSITPINTSTNSNSTSTPSSTPVTNFNSVLCLDRRPGIEIIPISNTPPAALPSSITITPITASQAKSMEERHKSEKKSSSRSSEERNREKKKKKKREDSMGPPDKLPPKPDPLTKPVSVSIKPADGSSLSRSSSPNSMIRKFSPSPTHGRSVSITKSPSPSNLKSIGKPSGTTSHHSSPRHSPVHNSPKHGLSGYSSPKNHSTSSPKHSSSSSGKPSMSAIKSAASGSPSSKSSGSGYDLSKSSKSSKDGYSSSSNSRERERKSQSSMSFSGSGRSSPKLKPSTVKLKQLEITPVLPSELQSNEGLVSPPMEVSKSSMPSQVRNRKGSLSAVIDKLKSAQYCGSELEVTVTKTSSSGSSNKDRSNSNSNKVGDPKVSSLTTGSKTNDKNQEYMVKPSSDGMKITINKTRTKESTSSGSKSIFSNSNSTNLKPSTSPNMSSSGIASGSPKTHTGLKPGVLSGPASKKTQVLQSSKTVPSNSNSSGSSSPNSNKISMTTSSGGNGPKVPYTKSSSNSSMTIINMTKSLSKSSNASPRSSTPDISKIPRDRDKDRDKSKSSKSSGSGGSDKSIFSSSKNEKRSSPAPPRDEIDGERSTKTSLSKDSNPYAEGLFPLKTLDTSKFQIPKLSARSMTEDNSSKNQIIDKNIIQERSSQNESPSKMLEYLGSSSKYPFQHITNTKMSDINSKTLSAVSITKPIINMESTSPKLHQNLLISKSESYEQPTNLSFNSKHQIESSKEQKNDKVLDISKSSSSKDDSGHKIDYGLCSNQKSYPAISVCSAETVNQNYAKQLEASKTFVAPPNKSNTDDPTKKMLDMSMKAPLHSAGAPKSSSTPQEAAEMLLDFSTSSGSKGYQDLKGKFTSVVDRAMSNIPTRRNTPPLGSTGFPASPSVSVHIVKSPVPSPLIIPSPHSSSPCITDDELMDEALVGSGK